MLEVGGGGYDGGNAGGSKGCGGSGGVGGSKGGDMSGSKGGGTGGGGVGGGSGGSGGAAGGGSGGNSALEMATASGAREMPRLVEMVPCTEDAVRLVVRTAASFMPPDSLTCSCTSTSESVPDTTVTAALAIGTAATTLCPSGTARTTASCNALARPRRCTAATSSARARCSPPRLPVLAVQLGSLRSHTKQSCETCWHACCTDATASSTVPSMVTVMVHACRTTTLTSASRARLPRLAATS
jgi:hypothetical protein